jgi:hypothetical protein
MKIVNAQWKIGKPVAGATYKVKGTGPGQIAIPPTAATLVGTDVIEINNVAAINAFQADLVQFYDTFNIKWEVSVNDGPYQNAESSNNPIYVCLKGPNANGLPTPYRTVVHVACASAGATDADEATANTWGRLSAGGMGPANLMGWDEAAQAWARPLYYYKPGTTLNGNGLNSTAALLQNPNSTGQCTAWTFLFYDAIRLNNASALGIQATINVPLIVGFLVKAWIPNKFAGWKTLQFGTNIPDMIPKPQVGGKDSEVYGDFTNQQTIVGQNSAPQAPSEKVFSNHVFVKYTKQSDGSVAYYDPSYGAEYSGELDFQQSAIDGFAKQGMVVGGFYQLPVEQTPAANGVNFDEIPFQY